jgi:hypothetical protein
MTRWWKALAVAVLLLLSVGALTPPEARAAEERSTVAAMGLSIAHPGLGEWYLQGWGPFERCPQKKFWLGFVPLYGWPGYLQVKSAIDAKHGRTNDALTFDER